jgi:hypothetical protein
MRRIMLAVLALLLLPSCLTVEWIPTEPMDVTLHVGAGAVVTTKSGEKYRIAGDAVMFPFAMFRQMIATLGEAVKVLEDDANEEPFVPPTHGDVM